MIYHLKNKIVRLNHLLPFIIFFVTLIPCSSEACTLKIPRQSKFKISSTGQCRFSIENNKKYFDLAYYKATNQGFDNLIREGIDITASNGDLYLPMEFIQDANYGIEQLSPRIMKNSSSYPLRLESASMIYVMSIPKKQFTGAQTFSLKLKCLEAAGGGERTSFTTRYCLPLSKKTDRELTAYKKFIARVTIQQDR